MIKRREEIVSETVKLRPSTKQKLDEIRLYPRESYDEIIARLIAIAERCAREREAVERAI